MKIGQGRENSKQFLNDNQDVLSEIIIRVREFMGLNEEAAEKEK